MFSTAGCSPLCLQSRQTLTQKRSPWIRLHRSLRQKFRNSTTAYKVDSLVCAALAVILEYPGGRTCAAQAVKKEAGRGKVEEKLEDIDIDR